MIAKLRELLDGLGLDSSPETIADLLWLAQRVVPADASNGRGGEAPPDAPPENPDKGPVGSLDSLWTRVIYSADDQPTQYYAAVPNPTAHGNKAKAARVPAVRAVADPLAITRALRPLKRKEPSRWRWEVDVAATIAGIAETGILDIVQRPEADRWLDLVLVVDDGLSMRLWRQAAEELRILMTRLGAFRTIRYRGLDADSPQRIVIRSKPFDRSSAKQSLGTTIDPTGRTVVLVLTDGIAEGWRSGAARRALGRWAANGPVALVQPLPARLWPGTKIDAERFHLRSRTPAGPNRRVEVSHPLIPSQLLPTMPLPVPVLETSASSMRRWAQLVLGTDAPVTMPMLDAAVPVEPTAAVEDEQPDVPAGEALRHFRGAASPDAYRLAAQLAAVLPLTLPVMRIMQDVLPGTTTAHLAEVFLGGLLQRSEEPDAYDFLPGVRTLLLETLDLEETSELIRAVGTRISNWLGGGPDAPALRGNDSGGAWLHPDAQPFAVIDTPLRNHTPTSPDGQATPGTSTTPNSFRSSGAIDRSLGTEVTLARIEIVADRFVAVEGVAVTRDGTHIVTCTRAGRIQVWDAVHGSENLTFFRDFGRAAVLTVGKRTLWIVSYSETSNTVDIWDFEAAALVHRQVFPGRQVSKAALSPDGRFLAISDFEGPVWLVDVHHPDVPPRALTDHDRMVNALAFSADSALLATGSYDGVVRLWNVDEGALLHAFVGHKSRVNTLAFSSDGTWIVSGANHETIRLWDTAGRRVIGALTGHRGWVSAVTVSPDNMWIATVGEDRIVRVWESATGYQAALIQADGDCCAWTPDGSVLAVGGFFGLSLYRFEQRNRSDIAPGT